MHFFASEAVSILVAILGGIVMVFCYPVFVFIVGTIPLAAICAVCGVQPGFFTMLLSIACGVTALIYRKHIVIPVSAMSGSLMLAFGLTLLFKGIHPALFIILFVLFMASGIFIQYKSAKDLLELGQNLTHLVSEQYKKYAPKKNLNEDGKEPEATK